MRLKPKTTQRSDRLIRLVKLSPVLLCSAVLLGMVVWIHQATARASLPSSRNELVHVVDVVKNVQIRTSGRGRRRKEAVIDLEITRTWIYVNDVDPEHVSRWKSKRIEAYIRFDQRRAEQGQPLKAFELSIDGRVFRSFERTLSDERFALKFLDFMKYFAGALALYLPWKAYKSSRR